MWGNIQSEIINLQKIEEIEWNSTTKWQYSEVMKDMEPIWEKNSVQMPYYIYIENVHECPKRIW